MGVGCKHPPSLRVSGGDPGDGNPASSPRAQPGASGDSPLTQKHRAPRGSFPQHLSRRN